MLVGSSVLGFLSSTGGRVLILGAAFVLWTTYQRTDAASEARRALREEIAAETAAARDEQLEIARALAEAAEMRADNATAQAQSMEKERDEIIEALRGSPDFDCDIPDDVRQRLLAIGS